MADYGKVGIEPGGVWTAQTDYEELVLVTRLGESYTSVKPSKGVDPALDVDPATGIGTYWYKTGSKGDQGEKGDAFTYDDFTPEQLEGLRGPQGPTGATGATGAQGPQGPQGEQGPSGTTDYNDLENKPTIPSALSDLDDDSTHRTVSDAEKQAWNAKQAALQWDATPTQNSPNPVTSGGVFTALSQCVTVDANNLVNYYRKNETYSQQQLDAMVGGKLSKITEERFSEIFN